MQTETVCWTHLRKKSLYYVSIKKTGQTKVVLICGWTRPLNSTSTSSSAQTLRFDGRGHPVPLAPRRARPPSPIAHDKCDSRFFGHSAVCRAAVASRRPLSEWPPRPPAARRPPVSSTDARRSSKVIYNFSPKRRPRGEITASEHPSLGFLLLPPFFSVRGDRLQTTIIKSTSFNKVFVIYRTLLH